MSSPIKFEYMEYIIVTLEGWKLDPDAPDFVKEAYEEWEAEQDMSIPLIEE